jgi:Ser/Thr protein kinase RdoA (MazF antagonist)
MSMDELAAAALPRFGLSPDATARLCNVSENHTFRVDDPVSGRAYALRVHRPGYRTGPQIESELDWLEALRQDGAVDTCVAVTAPGGERVVEVAVDGAVPHNVVLFEWLPGAEPDPEGDEVIAGFRILGAISSRMHAHAALSVRPGTTRTPSAPRDTGAGGRTASAWGPRSAACSPGSTPPSRPA